MAKGGIKGITIELMGDSSKLVKGLGEAEKAARSIDKSLRQVNQALKLDPSNVDALAKKQELLNRAIETTGEKLVLETKAADAAKKALDLGEITQDQYEEFDLQILKTSSTLADLERQAQQTQSAIDGMGETELIPDSAGESIQDLHDKTELLSKGLDVVAKAGDMAGAALQKGFELAAAAAEKVYEAAKQVGEWSYDISEAVVDAYGNYEQLAGGVEKLFGSAADTVIRNSARAYETAGLDANQYLETITSFSASLISGLGGDTQLAADVADQALRDMSDNANTFGSDIQSIMSAYQGFAKGNYNMLDNLRLGYGGTKTEMVRLINDAGLLNETIEDLNDVSFADIIRSITVIQDRMNITGTTSREAATTIQGSINMLKASWQNLLIGLGQDGSDVDALTNNLANSLLTVIDNVKPVLERMADRIPEIAPILIEKVKDALPDAVAVASEIFAAVAQAIIESAPDVANAIMDAVGPILDQIFGEGTADKVKEALNELIEKAPELVSNVVEPLIRLGSTLIEYLPQIVDAAIPLIEFVAEHLPEIAGTLATIAGAGTLASIASGVLNIASSISVLTGSAGAISGAGAALGEVGTAGAAASVSLGSIASTAGPIAVLVGEVVALGVEIKTFNDLMDQAHSQGITTTEALAGGFQYLGEEIASAPAGFTHFYEEVDGVTDYFAQSGELIVGGVLETVDSVVNVFGEGGSTLAEDWMNTCNNLNGAMTDAELDAQAEEIMQSIQNSIETSGAAATESVADDVAIINQYLDALRANGDIEITARVTTVYQDVYGGAVGRNARSTSLVNSGQADMAARYAQQERQHQTQQRIANSEQTRYARQYAEQQAEQGRAAIQAIQDTAETAQRAIGGGGSSGGGGGGGGGSKKSDEELKSSSVIEVLESIKDMFSKLLEKFGIQTEPTEYQNNVNQMIDGLLKALENNYSDEAIEAAKAEIQKTMSAYGLSGEMNAETLEQLRNMVNNPTQNMEAFGQVQASVSAIQAATVDYTPHFQNIESVLGELLTLKLNETDTINVYVGNELLDSYIQQSIANQAAISGGVA